MSPQTRAAPNTRDVPSPATSLGTRAAPTSCSIATTPCTGGPGASAALDEAKATGKPILLSIGYAACHWCHVMAHESFEDPAVAALMNEHFVNIKVDREERPDIDQIYMAALHALGVQGGWPLTMFLTPDGEPFWGGTYFPPAPRFGQPGFPDVLRSVASVVRDDDARVATNIKALMARLEEVPERGFVGLGRADLDQVATRLSGFVDPIRGGPRGAPKFPNAAFLELLWRGGNRMEAADPRDAFLKTVEQICLGGIRDHVGGGFARYAVDERWLVPHFEKMLYDNAQLLDLLALAHGETGRSTLSSSRRRAGRVAPSRDDDGRRSRLRLLARCRPGGP